MMPDDKHDDAGNPDDAHDRTHQRNQVAGSCREESVSININNIINKIIINNIKFSLTPQAAPVLVSNKWLEDPGIAKGHNLYSVL